MSQIRTSTIKAIAPIGEWNGMQKYLVTMGDGIGYTFFWKKEESFPKNLNDEVSFEVTNEQYKNAKFAKAYQNNYQPKSYNGQSNGQSNGQTSKDELIVRQTVIKSAAELHARSGNIDLVLQDAENMFNWIYKK